MQPNKKVKRFAVQRASGSSELEIHHEKHFEVKVFLCVDIGPLTGGIHTIYFNYWNFFVDGYDEVQILN